jgi:predicted nucleic acid-binding protein
LVTEYSEGSETLSPYDVMRHLIHGKKLFGSNDKMITAFAISKNLKAVTALLNMKKVKKI